MPQHIEVTPAGITVTMTTEPLVSVFGKVMSAGTSSTYELPWPEIARIYLPGADEPDLIIDHVNGEYFEIHPEAEGLPQALQALTGRPEILT